MSSSCSPEDEAAIDALVARLERIDATYSDWVPRMDARIVLMREEPWKYVEAARRYEGG
jgi:hypothetical protein